MGVGVFLVGVLVIRALLFGVYSRAPDSWKLVSLTGLPEGRNLIKETVGSEPPVL